MKNIRNNIKEAKGKFFKRLSKTIFDERVASHHLPALKKQHQKLAIAFEDSCLTETRGIFNYSVLNQVLAVYRVLTKYYELEADKYEEEDVVTFCHKLWYKYKDSFWKSMDKNIGKRNFIEHGLPKEQAYTELLFRGFRPSMVLKKAKTKKEFHILSHTFGIYHPVNISNAIEAEKYQKYLAVMGHCGYHHPTHK